MSKKENLRGNILEMVGEYAKLSIEHEPEFIKGETHVAVSGKQIGKEEIQYAVDACLDGWFTTGRFAEQFEKNLQYI